MTAARIGKYHNGGYRRMVQVFPFGPGDGVILAYSDPGWAGPASRRTDELCVEGVVWQSTGHQLKRPSPCRPRKPSSTLPLRLSVKRRVLRPKDFGEDRRIGAHIDAQATIGLSHRAGLGKARHMESPELWIQDAVERREFELIKAGGESNPAAVLAKPAPRNV